MAETAEVSFIAGTQFLGSACVRVTRTNGDRPSIWMRDHAFFCPACGEIWGRILHIAPPIPLTYILPAMCRKHGDGSFLSNYPEDTFLLQTASRNFLLYELITLLEAPNAASNHNNFIYTNDATGGYITN